MFFLWTSPCLDGSPKMALNGLNENNGSEVQRQNDNLYQRNRINVWVIMKMIGKIEIMSITILNKLHYNPFEIRVFLSLSILRLKKQPQKQKERFFNDRYFGLMYWTIFWHREFYWKIHNHFHGQKIIILIIY